MVQPIFLGINWIKAIQRITPYKWIDVVRWQNNASSKKIIMKIAQTPLLRVIGFIDLNIYGVI